MRLALLLAAGALTAFAITNAVASAVIATLWRSRAARWSTRASGWLLLIRVFPAGFSTAFVALAFIPSFLIHEPRHAVEAVSPYLGLAAGLGFAILASGAARWLVTLRRTRRMVNAWRSTGRPIEVPGWGRPAYGIEAPFPGVFVAGCRRPTLFVASDVADACTPAELAAIVAHELAHTAAGDNLKKLALSCLPDLLGLLRVAGSIENAWNAAVEEEADAAAIRGGAADRVELAGAIVKVARLARPVPASLACGSLFARGPVEERVRRLIREGRLPERGAAPRDWMPWLTALALPPVVLLHPDLSGRLHAVTEFVVKLLGCD